MRKYLVSLSLSLSHSFTLTLAQLNVQHGFDLQPPQTIALFPKILVYCYGEQDNLK